MRNLQKILALVLALVMSFSLVTTAGAFSDDGDITASYNDAVKVLNGLEVFKGYDNGATFQPKGSITRAEVAAIIYRIATGDVKDAQASIYSSYGQFTDVLDGSWYAGYVNYCANAGYIKGRGNKIFAPQDPVKGYEALAMILRAVGYDKNGEFTGSNWQTRTASIANERGITKNITSAMLGQNASREMVAEILFRSILVNKVNFNANTLSYTPGTTSIGYDSFKLEEVTGVVTANEFADLYDTEVLTAGKTNLEVAKGDVRTLNYTTELTDIGEKQDAYITSTEVLAMTRNADVKVFETNAKLDISTDKKFEDETGMKNDDDITEFYVNFGQDANWKSDWRIAFELNALNGTGTDEYPTKQAFADFIERKWDIQIANPDRTIGENRADGKNVWTWRVEYKIDDPITPPYQDVIEYIFNVADKRVDEARDYVTGEVYAGTTSTKDISDELSFKQFKNEYIKEDNYDTNWNESDNGEWVKVIDNNNDGKADYAFLTEYWLDEATHSRTKDGETEIEFNSLNSDDWDYRYADGYTCEVGDVVLYTLIDGQALIEEVAPVKATINKIDFKNETITTTDGNEYGQSGIFDETDMDDIITKMDEKVEYNLYMDKYGYVRAYELTAGSQYGLITELYYGYEQNGRFVKNKDLTVEMRAGSEKVDEYQVTNERNNEFLGESWLDLAETAGVLENSPYYAAYNGQRNQRDLVEANVLQPATAHLGLNEENESLRFSGPNADQAALTNIAKYVKDGDDGVKITSAAEYATNRSGSRLYYNLDDNGKWIKNTARSNNPVYAVDYIQLDTSGDIKGDQRVFNIDVSANNKNNVPNTALMNSYVNAVHDTEFYIVSGGNDRVVHFTDYKNLDEIKKSTTSIKAMYAVARNTEADNAKNDYWVADVIVIEVDNWAESYDSISLAYFTNNYSSGTVRSLDTLNNEASSSPKTVVPNPDDYNWDIRDWRDRQYGFYRLFDTTTEGDTITADSILQITNNFKDYKIRAGVITRINVVDGGRDRYIMVNTGENDRYYVDVDDATVYGIVEERNQANWRSVAETLHLCDAAHSDVKENDRIIWIGNDEAKFIVDISWINDDDETAPSWLDTLYNQIWNEQNPTVDPVETARTAKISSVNAMVNGLDLNAAENAAVKTAYDALIAAINAATALDTNGNLIITDETALTEALKKAIEEANGGEDPGEGYTVAVRFVTTAEDGTETEVTDGVSVTGNENKVSGSVTLKLNVGAYKIVGIVNDDDNTITYTQNENNEITLDVTADLKIKVTLETSGEPSEDIPVTVNLEGVTDEGIEHAYVVEVPTAETAVTEGNIVTSVKPGMILKVDPAAVLQLTGDVTPVEGVNGAWTVNEDAAEVVLSLKGVWNYGGGMWVGTSEDGFPRLVPNLIRDNTNRMARMAEPVPTEGAWLYEIVTGDQKYTYVIKVGEYTFIGEFDEEGALVLRPYGYETMTAEEKATASNAFVANIGTIDDVTRTDDLETDFPELVDSLAEARAAAVEAINGHKSDEIEALPEDKAAEAAEAKETALAAIKAAEDQTAIDDAVAAYKAKIDELTAAQTVTKFVVEPVNGNQTVLNERVRNLQDNVEVNIGEDGSTIIVTGNTYYKKDWSDYSSNPNDRSGYFVALKVTHPEARRIVVTRENVVTSGNTRTVTLEDDGILVNKAGRNNPDIITLTAYMANGTSESATLNLDGLKAGGGEDVFTVSTVNPDDVPITGSQVKISDLFEDLAISEPDENNTFKVTGTSFFHTGGSGEGADTAWNSFWGANDDEGFYIGVTLNFPGATKEGKDIVYYYTDTNGQPITGAGKEHYAGDGDTLLWRLKLSQTGKPLNNIVLNVRGTEYTIDVSGVVTGNTEATFEAAASGNVVVGTSGSTNVTANVSEIQKDITLTANGKTITATGTSLWYAGNDSAKGNYVAVKVTWPGLLGDEVKSGWSDANVEGSMDGIHVFKLSDEAAKTADYVAKISANGVTYSLDLSKITRIGDPDTALKVEGTRTSDDLGSGKKAGDFFDGTMSVSADGVVSITNGALSYYASEAAEAGATDGDGFYVPVYVNSSENVENLWYREAGTTGAGEEVTIVGDDNNVFAIPVMIVGENFKDGGAYEKIEIATTAPAARTTSEPDWSNSFTLDVSGLTLGHMTEQPEPGDYWADVGETPADKKVNQDIKVTGTGTEFTVTGTVQYSSEEKVEDIYGADERPGFYGVLYWDLPLGKDTVFYRSSGVAENQTKLGPDGEKGWLKGATETDGRLELMFLISQDKVGEKDVQETQYVWIDGIKYTVHWNVTLGPISSEASQANE